MPAPYNYMASIPRPDLARSVQAGAALGEAIGGAMQASRDREFQKELQDTLKKPGFRSFNDLMAKYPDKAENIQKLNDRMDAAEKEATYKTGIDVYTALETGNFDTAKTILDEQIAAGKNAGRDMRVIEGIRTKMDQDPRAAQAGIGLWLAGSDPKRWSETTTAFESRAKSKAEREKVEVTVKKLGEEIGLTRAQIAQAEASTAAARAAANKSGAEAERARAEAEQMARGVMPVEKRAEAETKLRKEYIDNTKDFSATQDAYRKITAAEDTAAGDISLIFSYMKMLDPGSVVREGEFATAQNAAGVPERVQNLYNQAINGERLNDKQRNMFTNQAEKLYDASAVREKQVRDGLTRIGQGYGLNLDNVFYQPGGVEKPQRPPKPSAGPVAGSGAVERTATALPSEFSAPGVVPTGGSAGAFQIIRTRPVQR